MTDKQIIEDCPHFIGGCCQEYLDGVCENHKCDLKIIREFEQKLKAKEQECEELKKQVDDLLHKPEIQDKIVWKIDNEALLGSKDAYIYKLEKTLTEIKEIAKDESYIGFWDEQITEILQKISECEGNDEKH